MKLKTAYKILVKDMEFLGLNWQEFCTFVVRNPYSQKNQTIKAFGVYREAFPNHVAKTLQRPAHLNSPWEIIKVV